MTKEFLIGLYYVKSSFDYDFEQINHAFDFVRIRRLYTNPMAISDVQKLLPEFIIQQSITCAFHALQYYNAFNGYMCLTIKQVYTVYQELEYSPFIERLFHIHNNWNHEIFTISSERDILYITITLFDGFSNKLYVNRFQSYKSLKYINNR
jgi:hypothetical protein